MMGNHLRKKRIGPLGNGWLHTETTKKGCNGFSNRNEEGKAKGCT